MLSNVIAACPLDRQPAHDKSDKNSSETRSDNKWISSQELGVQRFYRQLHTLTFMNLSLVFVEHWSSHHEISISCFSVGFFSFVSDDSTFRKNAISKFQTVTSASTSLARNHKMVLVEINSALVKT